MRAYLRPVPVCLPDGLPDDDRLLAAWSHLALDDVRRSIAAGLGREVGTVRHARRRVLALRTGAA